MKTAVYRHFDSEGVLLYVGASACPACRMAGHTSASCWAQSIARIDVEWFNTREEALQFERKEIMRLKPKHNAEWKPRVPTKWVANQGHVFIEKWMDYAGVSVAEFASRVGVHISEARRLSQDVAHVQIPKAIAICIATDGFVPTWAWDRYSPTRDDRPALRMPTSQEAAAYLSDALDRAKCGSRMKLSGYALSQMAQEIPA